LLYSDGATSSVRERLGDQRLTFNRRRERGKGMRKVTARVLTLALVVVAMMAIGGVARAVGETITWDGVQGADNLPCGSNVHWNLLKADGILAAELFVDGVSQGEMQLQGNHFTIFSDAPVDEGTVVEAEVTDGTPTDDAFLTLSSCTPPATTPPASEPPPPAVTGFNALPFVGLGLLLLAGGTFALRRRTV
jgi:hypothetical protein